MQRGGAAFLGRVFLLAIAATMLPATAARAEERQSIRRIGAWDVGHYPSVGCVIDHVGAGTPMTTLEWHDGKVNMMAADRSWTGFPAGRSHPVMLRFEPGGVRESRAFFSIVGKSEYGTFVWVSLADTSFLDDLARNRRLRIEFEGRVLANYDLTGIAEALRVRAECERAGTGSPPAARPAAPVVPRPATPNASPPTPLPGETNPLR